MEDEPGNEDVKQAARIQAQRHSSATATSIPDHHNGLKESNVVWMQMYDGILKMMFKSADIRHWIYETEATPAEPITYALQTMFMQLQFGDGVVDPQIFYSVFEKGFKEYLDEKDGQKFLNCVKRAVDNEAVKSKKKRERSLADLFKGTLVKYTQCIEKEHVTSVDMENSDLSVQQRTGDGHIETMLRELFVRQPEIFRFYCNQCTNETGGRRGFTQKVWPFMLVVHAYGKKIILEDLERYEIIGVTMANYQKVRTFTKNTETSEWFEFSASVKRLGFDEVQQACQEMAKYIIFYREIKIGPYQPFPKLSDLPRRLLKRLEEDNLRNNVSGSGGSSGSQQQSNHLVEFRAGKMFTRGGGDTGTPMMVHTDKRDGLVYIWQSDDALMHFCWKDRTSGTVEECKLNSVIDLILFPDEVEFIRVDACTTGRVFLLKFKNSMRKLFFWMQEPKTNKDEEHCKKVNDLLNNPPVRGSGRGGQGGSGHDNDQFAMMNELLGGISENALSGMDPQQPMSLLNMMGAGLGGSNNSMESTPPVTQSSRRTPAAAVPTPQPTPADGGQQGGNLGTSGPRAQVQVSDLSNIIANLGTGLQQPSEGNVGIQSLAEILEIEGGSGNRLATGSSGTEIKKEEGKGTEKPPKKDKDDEGMDLD